MIAILIDDDPLIRKGWSYKASKEGLDIHCFDSVNSFIGKSYSFSKEVPIYIDSNLGASCKGEVQAKEIFDLGFRNIYLITGYTDINISHYPWLKAILPKIYPF